MIEYIFFTILGFFLLIKGADLFVDAIKEVSTHLKIPKIIISLTIVAFGTSAPELFISFQGLIGGNDSVVLANVVGSTIVNSLLVIGVSALIRPIKIKNETIKKQLPIHLIITSIFSILLLDNIFNNSENIISRSDGIILFLIFICFLCYIYYYGRKQVSKKDLEEITKWSLKKSIIYSILGIVLISFGSNLAVDNCINIANLIGVSEKLITMVVLVIGTSMPELIMGINAAKKGEFDIVIGNIVGTNIFNIGFVLGLPVIVFGNVNAVNFNIVDMFFVILSSLLLYLFSKNDRRLSKREGFVMLFSFLIYYIYLFLI